LQQAAILLGCTSLVESMQAVITDRSTPQLTLVRFSKQSLNLGMFGWSSSIPSYPQLLETVTRITT
jgi:hypothetical protein